MRENGIELVEGTVYFFYVQPGSHALCQVGLKKCEEVIVDKELVECQESAATFAFCLARITSSTRFVVKLDRSPASDELTVNSHLAAVYFDHVTKEFQISDDTTWKPIRDGETDFKDILRHCLRITVYYPYKLPKPKEGVKQRAARSFTQV